MEVDVWNFGNGFTKNALIFGVGSTSSSHTDNQKHDLLLLGKGSTYEINGGFGIAENKFSITFSEAKTKLCLSLHNSGDNKSLYINKTEIYKCKAHDNMRWYGFCLRRVSKVRKIDKMKFL